MHNSRRLIQITNTALLILACSSIGACAGMTQQEKNTAIGAGIGAVGGVVGHEIKK